MTMDLALCELCDDLPAEVEEGSNTEYKYHLARMDESRIVELETQLRWRLREGRGTARYCLGVTDDGRPLGLLQSDMDLSFTTLTTLVSRVEGASIRDVRRLRGCTSDAHEVRIVEVSLSTSTGLRKPAELRIAVVGATGAGKSSLIGVLTTGALDSGHGSARLVVARHRHEIETGETSSTARHTLSPSPDREPSSLDGARDDGISSLQLCLNLEDDLLTTGPTSSSLAPAVDEALQRTVTLIDLAGDERYRRTAITGLLGSVVDAAILAVSADVTPSASENTLVLAQLLLDLNIPTYLVCTHIDKDSFSTSQQFLQLRARLAGYANVVGTFGVSSVSGAGIGELTKAIFSAQQRPIRAVQADGKAVLAVQEMFNAGSKHILAGTCISGRFHVGDFAVAAVGKKATRIRIASIHHLGRETALLAPGESGSFSYTTEGGEGPTLAGVRPQYIYCPPAPVIPATALALHTASPMAQESVKPGSTWQIFILGFKTEGKVVSVDSAGPATVIHLSLPQADRMVFPATEAIIVGTGRAAGVVLGGTIHGCEP